MKRDAVGQSLASRLDAMEARGRPHAGVPPQQAVRQPALRARQGAAQPALHHARAHRAHRSLQADRRSRRLRPVPLRAARVRLRQLRRLHPVRRLRAPRGAAELHRGVPVRAMFDRIEWRIIPDSSTAANALVAGEVDWLEIPIPDLLPLLRKSRDVVVDRARPDRPLPGPAPELAAGPDRQQGRPPSDPGRDRPARDDAGGHGRGTRRRIISRPAASCRARSPGPMRGSTGLARKLRTPCAKC